jgi:transcriptional regulator with XRE-family HTH domain
MLNSPSLRRRRLVSALRRLREAEGLTMADAAERAGFSEAKLSRVESLKNTITGDDTFILAKALGADEVTVEALVSLARSAKQRDWWHVYNSDEVGRFANFLELEDDAKAIRGFEADLIPGQLQTPAYAEAVIRHAFPDAEDDEIAQRVQLRVERQRQVAGRAFELWAIIDEAALKRPIGGWAVMIEQLDHLARVAQRPGTTVRVLPTSVTGHPAMGVPFALITLNDGAEFVYLDTLTGGAYIEDLSDVVVYQRVWSRLQSMAADFDRSGSLIRQAAAEHRSVSRR